MWVIISTGFLVSLRGDWHGSIGYWLMLGMMYGSLLLAKDGFNPTTDVKWKDD
jgi:hypothetical protein